MPRSIKDGLYFKDFEKLVFGDETALQSTMYHDGAKLVFENITISGAQGPAGPPGAGVPGDILTNDTGNTGIEVSSAEHIEFWQNVNAQMLIKDNTVIAGTNPSYYHNWGALMVKSAGSEHDFENDGLKMGYFGPSGYQTIDFIRSSATSTQLPTPTQTGYNVGAVTWGTFDYDREGITPYARILGVDTYAEPINDIHKMDIQLQTKDGVGGWQTNFRAIAGTGGGVQFNKGQIIEGVALDMAEIDSLGVAPTNMALTAFGVQQEIGNFRTEFDYLMSTISGAEHWEVFDTTISGARIECNNPDELSPSIDFKIKNTKVSWFDEFGAWHLGAGSPPIVACIDDELLDETGFNGETIATTAALKSYIDSVANAGAGSHYLLATNGDKLTIEPGNMFTTFNDVELNMEMKYTTDIVNLLGDDRFYPNSRIFNIIDGSSRSGSRMIIGSKTFNQMKIFTAQDVGHSGWGYNNMGDDRLSWVNQQWSRRVQVSQKHNLLLADTQGSSMGIVGWNGGSPPNHQEYQEVWKLGPQLSMIKLGGTPEEPTHVLKGDVVGRIAFDYAAYDNTAILDRAGWIECRLGVEYMLQDSDFQLPGGGTAPRSDFHYVENELVLGASSYVHFGRIRLRSKLYFDDGSENFVSGIIQSDNSPVQGIGPADVIGETVEGNPWGEDTPERWPWGMDHVIPSAQWVLDKIQEGVTPTEWDLPDAITSKWDCYNCNPNHIASMSQTGFHVRTGWAPGDIIFEVSGQSGSEMSSAGRFTWGMRLASKSDHSKFFIENYYPNNTVDGQPATGQMTFFKARGGDGMNAVKYEGSALDERIIASNNGALLKGDIIGQINAIGQARGNGIDRDPCTYWAGYEPAAQIIFRADYVDDTYVHGGTYFRTSVKENNYNVSGGIDWKGISHWGQQINTGGPPPGGRFGYGHTGTARDKGIMNITGGASPNYPVSPKSTLSLWSATPSLSFSTQNPRTDTMLYIDGEFVPNDIHLSSRIAHMEETTKFGIGGLSFWIYNTTARLEEEAMIITENKRVIIGDKFTSDSDGLLTLTPDSNSSNYGLSIKSANNIDRLKLYHNPSGYATINAGENGNKSLRINVNQGKVYIGSEGYVTDPDDGKLIVNGHITPSTDNTWDLGIPTKRFDDVWATNGTIQVSDAREKTEVKDEKLGLNFINKLRPVSFKRTGRIRTHHGLIAQDVEKTLKSLGKSNYEFAGLIRDEKADIYGIRYEEMIAPMMKAIQELSAEVDTLKHIIKKHLGV